MNPQVSAITLGVKDLNRAKQFYSEGLGCPIQSVGAGQVRRRQNREGGAARPMGWILRLLQRPRGLPVESRIKRRVTATRARGATT